VKPVDRPAFEPYCGAAPVPAELLWRWNLDPPLLLALGILGAAIYFGTRHEWLKVASWQAAALGLLMLVVAFVSPLCALASALFSAREVHHTALVSLAAPLLAYGFGRNQGTAGWSVASASLFAVVLWLWHAPQAYAAALSSNLVYWIMQASLLGSAFLIWTAILGAKTLAGVGLSLASMLQMGLLGALLTFAPFAFYAPHSGSTVAWGLTALEDQQLAGALMWVVGGSAFFAAAIWHGLQLFGPRYEAAC
jgi:putative membrane protein